MVAIYFLTELFCDWDGQLASLFDQLPLVKTEIKNLKIANRQIKWYDYNLFFVKGKAQCAQIFHKNTATIVTFLWKQNLKKKTTTTKNKKKTKNKQKQNDDLSIDQGQLSKSQELRCISILLKMKHKLDMAGNAVVNKYNHTYQS